MSTEIFKGELIAPGVAVGFLRLLRKNNRQRPGPDAGSDPVLEADRFQRKVETLAWEIEEAMQRLESESLHDEAEILRVHLSMLQDPELHREVLALIQNTRHRAETAVETVLEGMATILGAAEDPVLAERAADIRDLSGRLKIALEFGSGHVAPYSMELKAGAVLAMYELLPSVVLAARESGVSGFIVESGTAVAHGAILAKSFGLPVVRVSALGALAQFEGAELMVGGTGEILVAPEKSEVDSRRPVVDLAPITPAAGSPSPGIWVSVVDPCQLEQIDWSGIEGVGLYRSEALFLRHQDHFPNEREQLAVYRRLFEHAGERTIVFRTVDLGADKRLEHMRFGPEENPCLGLRAHRLFHFHPEILITQIRAVLRAAHGRHRLRLLYPMLESIEQLRFVKGLVQSARQSLIDEGVPFQDDFLQGVLIETPSAAWGFSSLLDEVDFAGVGTNDLVQYLFAVERNAANVTHLYQEDHPTVLQVIRALASAAEAAGKSLSLCGELAADSSMIPVLLGLGVTDLSVAVGASKAVRRQIAGLDAEKCRQLADQCLRAVTAEEVRAILGGRSKDTKKQHREVSEGEALDPVCGMVVQVLDTPYQLLAGGVAHYFCSRSCLEQFRSAYVSTH